MKNNTFVIKNRKILFIFSLVMLILLVGLYISYNNNKLNAFIDISTNILNSNVSFDINTNLPNKTKLLVKLTNSKYNYEEEYIYEVWDKHIKTCDFSLNGNPLPLDKYNLSITLAIPSKQPTEVKKIIGKHGQNLTGNLASKKWTSYYTTLNKNILISNYDIKELN